MPAGDRRSGDPRGDRTAPRGGLPRDRQHGLATAGGEVGPRGPLLAHRRRAARAAAAGIPWDDRIPYPVFAVAAHLMLQDCPIEAGPTAVIPGSHRSGQAPPSDRASEDDLTCDGATAVPLLVNAGDVALFVSDVWHRRMPSSDDDPGRYFLQCHYGRRDLAQRLRTTADSNQLSPEARERAGSTREHSLVGLHPPGFYDG